MWHRFALYVNSVLFTAATRVAVVIIVIVNINLIFLQNVFFICDSKYSRTVQ